MGDATVGVYVHVPFCERVCPYCDFAVVAARSLGRAQETDYVDAVLLELERRMPVFGGRSLASLYLGGGTPSLLQPASVARIVSAVSSAFPAATDSRVEVTLEVNPSTLERSRLPGFREAGVNRVSLGVQSFDDEVLRRLGRAHGGDEGRRSLSACRAAGFDAISLDLIFAAPAQTLALFERDLAEVVAFGPEHVSTYELTIEAGTPFAAAEARGQLAVPNDPDERMDRSLAMMEVAEERLQKAGFRRYEISSYARPGFEAVHNRRYWQRRPVLGLGMGAFSTEPICRETPFGSRRANTRNLESYLTGMGADPGAVEVLDARNARGEAVFLALRAAEGLDAALFAEEFGAPPRSYWGSAISTLVADGLLEERTGPGDLRLTQRGRRVSDSVFAYFV
ncbi:MAG: radical SAM family heme chaperone HemW [Myxococcota bacterium]